MVARCDIYSKDDIVLNGGNTYNRMVGHFSQTVANRFNSIPCKWLLNAEGYPLKGDWQVNVRYANNDLFKYNGVIYRVLEEHPPNPNATTGILNDLGKLQVHAKINWRIDWTSATTYRVDDIVKYGGIYTYRLEEHTSPNNGCRS